MRRAAFALLLIAGCSGCAGPEPGSAPAPATLDRAEYVANVQPIVEARCATLDCHGNEDRPLRLYAVTGLRRQDAWRDLPDLMPEELDENVRAASSQDESLILDKALGRIHHLGGTIWESTDDPQYLCVQAWLSATTDPTACATAADQVALPPP